MPSVSNFAESKATRDLVSCVFGDISHTVDMTIFFCMRAGGPHPYGIIIFAVPSAQAEQGGLTAYIKKRESQLLETLS